MEDWRHFEGQPAVEAVEITDPANVTKVLANHQTEINLALDKIEAVNKRFDAWLELFVDFVNRSKGI